MNLTLISDEYAKQKFDLIKMADLLNGICKYFTFSYLEAIYSVPKDPNSEIDFTREAPILSSLIEHSNDEKIIYVTYRKFADNFFSHETHNVMILSFNGWQHYTSLPVENGLLYFITRFLIQTIDNQFRHERSIGCLYDFLPYKTDVDSGMRNGGICEKCIKRLQKCISPDNDAILADVLNLATFLSNTSKVGASVFQVTIKNQEDIITENWSTFEDNVSDLYREMGAIVNQNVNLQGFQIDILVEEETPSRQKIRSAIECKFYNKSKVGNREVNDFARIIKTLQDSGKVDKGVLVSSSGFTPDASLVSQTTGIELVTFKDLKQRIAKKGIESRVEIKVTTDAILDQKAKQIEDIKKRSPKIFVVMPFSPELDDLYFYGIRETAKNLKCTCDRVDTVEFVGSIIERIYDSIRNSEVIVAEVSTANPNVYYEVGYAHALNKPTILITKDISTAPFDLKIYNHIVYKNIRGLSEQLESRLKAIIT